MKKRKNPIKTLGKNWNQTHKFGAEIPNSISQARELEKKNGNTLWQDAIDKGMKNNGVVFDVHKNIYPGALEKAPRGYEHVLVHMILYIKVNTRFTRKEIFVADRNKVDTPP